MSSVLTKKPRHCSFGPFLISLPTFLIFSSHQLNSSSSSSVLSFCEREVYLLPEARHFHDGFLLPLSFTSCRAAGCQSTPCGSVWPFSHSNSLMGRRRDAARPRPHTYWSAVLLLKKKMQYSRPLSGIVTPTPALTPVAAEWHSLVPVQPLQLCFHADALGGGGSARFSCRTEAERGGAKCSYSSHLSTYLSVSYLAHSWKNCLFLYLFYLMFFHLCLFISLFLSLF